MRDFEVVDTVKRARKVVVKNVWYEVDENEILTIKVDLKRPREMSNSGRRNPYAEGFYSMIASTNSWIPIYGKDGHPREERFQFHCGVRMHVSPMFIMERLLWLASKRNLNPGEQKLVTACLNILEGSPIRFYEYLAENPEPRFEKEPEGPSWE